MRWWCKKRIFLFFFFFSQNKENHVYPWKYCIYFFLKFLSGFIGNCLKNIFREFQDLLRIFRKNPPLLLITIENYNFLEKTSKTQISPKKHKNMWLWKCYVGWENRAGVAGTSGMPWLFVVEETTLTKFRVY